MNVVVKGILIVNDLKELHIFSKWLSTIINPGGIKMKLLGISLDISINDPKNEYIHMVTSMAITISSCNTTFLKAKSLRIRNTTEVIRNTFDMDMRFAIVLSASKGVYTKYRIIRLP